jgi:thiamine-monophosphate kinase
MSDIAMGPGGEFDRIRAIADALGQHGPFGDDTARIASGAGTLVASVDVTVENVHFRREWLGAEEIGWRATAAALSDLAAAAAIPSAVLTAVTVPREAGEGELVAVMRGASEAARSVGAEIVGGDLSGGEAWSIAVTVLGHAKRPMSRVGAQVGDGVWVSGSLGGARAALEMWLAGELPSPDARWAFVHPEPRTAVGRWLAEHGATAMMDISDGLGGDAPHLAAASGVEIELELDHLPIHPAVSPVAKRMGTSSAEFAAVGGEDYELLVTLPAAFSGAAECEGETGVPLTRIGAVGEGAGVVATLRGAPVELRGYRHRIGIGGVE